jgi:hypothetical protein
MGLVSDQRSDLKESLVRLKDIVEGIRPPNMPRLSRSITSFVLPNHPSFIRFIRDTFNHDSLRPHLNSNTNRKQDVSLYPHQSFVREFLQDHSPYRGILLFHGLGVGKTRAAIAAAETLRCSAAQRGAIRKVIVLLPASLHANFVENALTSGPSSYRTQLWHPFPLKKDAQLLTSISIKLQLPLGQVSARRVIWLPVGSIKRHTSIKHSKLSNHKRKRNGEENGEENGGENGGEETRGVQHLAFLEQFYTFLHFNGISRENYLLHWRTLSRINPFDDAILIIDEVHRFVSLAQNPDSVGSLIYHDIMHARNMRILALSGTPIVNDPAECALLINLIAGPQFLRVITLSKTPDELIKSTLDVHLQVQSWKLDMLQSPPRILLELLPDHFIYENTQKSHVTFAPSLQAKHALHGILQALAPLAPHISLQQQTPLIPSASAFHAMFLDPVTQTMINRDLFVSKIIGHVSFYNVFRSDLFPRRLNLRNIQRLHPNINLMKPIIPDSTLAVVSCTMSDHQFHAYLKLRLVEIDKNLKKSKKAQKQQKDQPLPGSYRALSRALCNFAFPPHITRPSPSQTQLLLDTADRFLEGDEPTDVAGEHSSKENKYRLDMEKAVMKLDEYMTKAGDADVEALSPKMARVVEMVMRCEGTGLVYSQFKMVEGCRVLQMLLRRQGFREMRLEKEKDDVGWRLMLGSEHLQDVTGIKDNNTSLYDGSSNRYYFTYDNSPSSQMLMHLFNSDMDKLPRELRQLFDGRTNLRGELLKIMFVTQSGADGISLKNVRHSHILEPYWNDIRHQQVIGRCIRANSHAALEESERDHQSYVYVSCLAPQHTNRTLQSIDAGLTSDQFILALGGKKQRKTQPFLQCLAQGAVDAHLYHDAHSIIIPDFPPLLPTTFVNTLHRPSIDFEKIKKTCRCDIVRSGTRLFLRNVETGVLYDKAHFDLTRTLVPVNLP